MRVGTKVNIVFPGTSNQNPLTGKIAGALTTITSNHDLKEVYPVEIDHIGSLNSNGIIISHVLVSPQCLEVILDIVSDKGRRPKTDLTAAGVLSIN